MPNVFIKQLDGVANILKQLRGTKNIRQGDLAKELGVSRQTVSAIENGHYFPSLPLAFKIAAFFGMTVEEIFSFKTNATRVIKNKRAAS